MLSKQKVQMFLESITSGHMTNKLYGLDKMLADLIHTALQINTDADFDAARCGDEIEANFTHVDETSS